MLNTFILLSTLLVLGACYPLSLRPPRTPVPHPLRSDDSRRALVGAWIIDFGLDSAQRYPAPNTTATARGTLTLEDTVLADDLRGIVEVDFTPVLGRQICRFDIGANVFWIPIRLKGDSVSLRLSRFSECWVELTGRARGDTITGRWKLVGWLVPFAVGRFVMTRSE
jgi:hypothetical protein